jgi:hypothetical protein
MKQVEYDVQATLPVITEMLEQEAQKTEEISEKLVGIGETAIATTRAAVDMHKQTQENEQHLLKVIAEQQEILETLTGLTKSVNENHIDEVAIQELQQSFASKLDEVLNVHGADKDMIVSHIADVYVSYTERITALSEAIERLNTTLSDPDYQKRIDSLDARVNELTKLVGKIGDAQTAATTEQFKKVEALMEQLSSTTVVFEQSLEKADQNRTFIASVVQRMNMIEDRLDTLIDMSKQVEKDGE